MSVNFGYGNYGMTNGMGMNAGAYGSNMNGNSFISHGYDCSMCYQNGPVPYQYKTFVNPLPFKTLKPNFFSNIMKKLIGE